MLAPIDQDSTLYTVKVCNELSPLTMCSSMDQHMFTQVGVLFKVTRNVERHSFIESSVHPNTTGRFPWVIILNRYQWMKTHKVCSMSLTLVPQPMYKITPRFDPWNEANIPFNPWDGNEVVCLEVSRSWVQPSPGSHP